MSRRIVLSGWVLCVAVFWRSSALAQGPHFSTGSFNCNNSDQCLSVQQNGTGSGTVSNTAGSIPQPNLSSLPPAGVAGNGTSASGSSAGVLGTSAGSFGFGVLGVATGTPGANDNPSGIIGIATASSGKTRGVQALIFSPNGTAFSAETTGGGFFEASNKSGNTEIAHFSVDGSGNIITSGVLSLGVIPNVSGDLFHVDQFGNVQAQGNIQGAGNIQVNQGTFASLQVNGGNLTLTGGNINTGAGTVTTHAVSAMDGNFSGAVAISQLNGGQANFSGGVSIGGSLSTTGNGGFGNVTTGSLNAATGNFNSAVSVAGPLTVGQTATIGSNLQVNGNLNVSGTKSSIAEISGGRHVALYAVESPENWFEDFGSAKLDKGKTQVKLESVFAETVNPDLDYHVFLTPNGNCRGLYVAEKTGTGFVVRELGGGKSNISFDYRVVVRRKGYEKERLAEVGAAQTSARAESSIRINQ